MRPISQKHSITALKILYCERPHFNSLLTLKYHLTSFHVTMNHQHQFLRLLQPNSLLITSALLQSLEPRKAQLFRPFHRAMVISAREPIRACRVQHGNDLLDRGKVTTVYSWRYSITKLVCCLLDKMEKPSTHPTGWRLSKQLRTCLDYDLAANALVSV